MTESLFYITDSSTQCKARNGILKLPHGIIETPVFMPVGTNATVKAITSEDLNQIGFKIILSNAYHLYLRPGPSVIGDHGGLHKWMNWPGNILTDSGGYQIFSLASIQKILNEGIEFRSHIDGSNHFLSPEKVVEIQTILASDIQMQLDVCTSWGTDYQQAKNALITTTDWMFRAKKQWEKYQENYEGALFGIVQGNFYPDLRKQSVDAVISADLPGIAIGGLSVGEPFDQYRETLAFTAALLPDQKPRYLMGIGTPEYILEAIENGIDMFDCVFPTRTARNGLAFTHQGPLSIKKSIYQNNQQPLDPLCECKVCKQYSCSYIRHLFKCREILSSMLITYHNLAFLENLLNKIRLAIQGNYFKEFKKSFLEQYNNN